jgi:large subunit ribosomal protein L25
MKNQNTQEKLELAVTLRTEVGKKVKQLRKKGIVPANIFGPNFPSKTISMDLKGFLSVYKVAKETGIVYIQVEKDTIPTLIKLIQRHPISNEILHVDFRKINLNQKIETTVPVQIIGESKAVTQLSGVLLTQTDHLTVEALPQNIPPHIDIDISVITELGQEIKVSDLSTSADYVFKEEADKVIVSVIEHKEESVEVQLETAAPEITTAKVEGEESAEGSGETAAPAVEKEEKKAE